MIVLVRIKFKISEAQKRDPNVLSCGHSTSSECTVECRFDMLINNKDILNILILHLRRALNKVT